MNDSPNSQVKWTPIEGAPVPYEASQPFKSDLLSEEAFNEYQKILFSNWGYPEKPTILSIPANPDIDVVAAQAHIDQLLSE